MGRRIFSTLALAGLLLGAAGETPALSGNEQIALAGAGKFEELSERMEADLGKATMKTADWHGLCFAYAKLKRYNKLLPCLDKLEESAKGKDKRTRFFGLDDVTPALHTMRADAYLELGQYPQAIVEANKTLDWYRREDSDFKDIEINSLAVISLSHTLGGDRVNGEKYAQQLEKVNTSWPHGDYATAKSMAAARVYLALGNYEKTHAAIVGDKAFGLRAFLDNLVSGALLSGRNNWVWQELPRGFMLNKALFGMGRLAEAKAGYDQLMQVPQLKENGEIYWLLLSDRGRIAEQENNLPEAIASYAKAVDVIESQRSSINTEANKIGFVGDKQEVYGRIISALYRNNQPSGALEYIERSKARALVDLLASRQDFAAPPAAAEETRTLLASYNSADVEARAQVPVGAGGAESRQRNLVVKSAAAEKLHSVAPELASLVTVTSMQLKQIQALIPADEAVLQYYYQGNEFYAFVLTATGLQSVKLDKAGLEDDVRKFRETIEKREERSLGLAQGLYNRLVRPLEKGLAQKNLLIVPHGALHYLPFAALHDGNAFLIDKYALRSLPSASVLKFIKPKSGAKSDTMLVLGNPDLGDPRLDLPNAQIEAEDIARRATKATLLVRAKATETMFKQVAGDFNYIHVASHGEFESDTPLNSALLLAKDSASDGLLTVAKLYTLRLNADLVTLSACETGLGKIASGDDVVGLTRGFLYAGSSSVVASLWKVDDLATSELMTSFYANLKKLNKRDALRQAQLETKKKFPNPYFWAAFYLTGSAN